jgi:hypothetical protein
MKIKELIKTLNYKNYNQITNYFQREIYRGFIVIFNVKQYFLLY